MKNSWFLLCIVFLILPARLLASETDEELLKLISHGGCGLSTEGTIIQSHNLDTPFVPASILKIITSLAALKLLGEGYRFETGVYIDPDHNLYIKGYGDPFLVSEEIDIIAEELKEKKLSTIHDLYIDNSAFALATKKAKGAGNSLNPYDVANEATTVNFNTINITKSKSGKILSAEPQTPTLPLMSLLAAKLTAGTHRINISNNPANIKQYAGELFRAILRRHEITMDGSIMEGKAPAAATLLMTHVSSKSLTDIIQGLLRYSNNFIANQIFLVIGANRYGYPADWSKGRKAMAAFIADTFPGNKAVVIDEGSGLSRKNRVTPAFMLAVLNVFAPHASLLPEAKHNLIKSGTLTGVYSYAGYLRRPGNSLLYPFVIILNQQRNTRASVLKYLEKIVIFYKQ